MHGLHRLLLEWLLLLGHWLLHQRVLVFMIFIIVIEVLLSDTSATRTDRLRLLILDVLWHCLMLLLTLLMLLHGLMLLVLLLLMRGLLEECGRVS